MSEQFQIEYPADLHAPGAIDKLLAFHRQTFGGFRMEDGDDDGGSGSSGEGGASGGTDNGDKGGDTGSKKGDKGGDLGFPKDTPVKDMTPEQQAAYHQHQARKHETRAKSWHETLGGKTPEQVKADLDRLAELERSQLSDSQRAVEDAKAEGRAEAAREFGNQLVAAKFEAALSHVDEERRTQIIEGLNLSSYLDNEGRVDADKVKSYAAVVAPVDTTTEPRRRDWGAGRRTEAPTPRGAGGKSEAERRFGKTKSTADA